METIELDRKRTPTAGQTPVTITNTVEDGTRAEVIACRYVNLDTVAHIPVVNHHDGAAAVRLELAPGIPSGGIDKRWATRDQPIVLFPGESLTGLLSEDTTTTEGYWLVAAHVTTVSA